VVVEYVELGASDTGDKRPLFQKMIADDDEATGQQFCPSINNRSIVSYILTALLPIITL
jgi:hypothetical protein